MLILISIEILDFNERYIKILCFHEIKDDVKFKSFMMSDINKLCQYANFRYLIS